jgi:hypothetical protein
MAKPLQTPLAFMESLHPGQRDAAEVLRRILDPAIGASQLGRRRGKRPEDDTPRFDWRRG